ncbi:MAG: hypothetical protein HY077_01345 [Elusimicrobia bacterium]|nr:hypothetical protein [Elusimicrobiota bacterium]
MIFLVCALLALGAGTASAQPTPAASSTTALPLYLSLSPNINDFMRFASGGPDSNWYIGFNNAWIVKLPAAPMGDYTRAYIGAKIGRAKTRPNANKPWLREIIDGKVYMAISQSPSFASEQSYFLAAASDIPAEPDPQTFVEGVGEAQWFWSEVPISAVSFTRANYLIIWSPTKYFVRASSSPILAAASAEDSGASPETRAWNNHSITGVPPRNGAAALETPLNTIYPALAIKLISPNDDEISVADFSLSRVGRNAIAQFAVGGDDVIEAWVETSRDQLDWQRLSKLRREPPYLFTLSPEKIAPGNFLRGAAMDSSGNVGHSETFAIPYAPR